MVFVLGYGRDKVLPVVRSSAEVAIQESQFGTATRACGLAELSAGRRKSWCFAGTPRSCVPRRSARSLRPAAGRGPGIGLTGVLDDPTGYGRIVRGEDGSVARIVEEKRRERALRKVRE